MITAIILAGGIGTRVGKNIPKQFVDILGKPVIYYTIDIYQRNPNIDSIEIVCHKSWKNYLLNIIEKYRFTKVKWIIDGGYDFQHSVINGVNNLRGKISYNDYVMIHYGAAPFTSDKIVNDVVKVMKERGSAITATPCYQLLGSNDENRTSNTWVDRDDIIQIACPYGFRFDYLIDIYERSEKMGLIDSIDPHTTSLMYALGDTIYQAYGDQTNIKITTKEDLDLFEGYVLMKQKIKN